MRTLRPFVLASASALALALIAAAAARAGDVTYPQLNNASKVQDTDLIATWRGTGPLTTVNASVLESYILTAFQTGKSFLQPSNNLSDLSDIVTARSSLGLGSAATAFTGASGNALCLMNTNCTWSGTQTFGAKINWAAAAAGYASANCPNGASPTTKMTGDIWCVGGVPHYWDGATDHSVAFTDSSISGNAATATRLQTAQTINVSGGDLTGCTGANFNGTAAATVTGCTLIAKGTAGTYGNSTTVPQITTDANGRVTGVSNVAISYPSQLPSQSGYTSAELTTNGSSGSWTPRATLQAYSCSSSGCSIGNSSNVAQFNRLGVGAYQIVFSTAMPSNSYVFLCTVSYGSASGYTCQEEAGAIGSGYVQFYVMTSNGTPTDAAGNINVLVIAN